METATKEKVVYGSFLQDRIVSVKPVESSGKWSNLLVQGQERMKDPFLLNKAKRSYQVPLNSEVSGGGVKVILDDQKRVKIQKYLESYPNGMTQKEFFEKELGVNLNPTLKQEDNFWRIDRRGRVVLTKEGTTLNLNNAEVTNSKKATIGFIKSLGRTIPATATEDWLKREVLNIVDSNPKYFLEIVNHPQYDERIFVQEAIEAGAIIRKGEKRYTLDNGAELGDLTDTINYLLNPDNQEVKLRIKAKVDLAKR
jgi:hypothetical protein